MMHRTFTRGIGALAPCVVASILAACGDLGFTSEVIGRRPFAPPAIYEEWWSATQDCSGHQGDYQRIDWYLADGISGDGVVARGRWTEPHDVIIVTGYEEDQKVVRHEMLHDLLNGDPSHGRAEWDACDLRASTAGRAKRNATFEGTGTG